MCHSPVVSSPIPLLSTRDEFLDLRSELRLKEIVIFFQLQKVPFLIQVLSKVGSLYGVGGGRCSGSVSLLERLSRGWGGGGGASFLLEFVISL